MMVGKVKSVKMVSEKALYFHFYPKVVNCGENVDGGWVCQDLRNIRTFNVDEIYTWGA